jgi:short-subunit dehydrogenase
MVRSLPVEPTFWFASSMSKTHRRLKRRLTTVFGVMDTIRALLPHFRQRRSGTIVNVSSGAGVFSLPLISLYCASKFALEGFSEALSYELAALNIAVKIVEPGGVSGTNFGRRSGQEAAGAPQIRRRPLHVAYEEAVWFFAGLISVSLPSLGECTPLFVSDDVRY